MVKIGRSYFQNAFSASGARGFFGEGYRHHVLFRLIPGFDFSGSTFIAKTVTLNPRMPEPDEIGGKIGNLSLDPRTWKPLKWFPDCIKVFLWRCEAVNAVGLTNPGVDAVFERGQLQLMPGPIVISFMALEEEKEKRLQEVTEFCKFFNAYWSTLLNPVGLQFNVSCPNTDHDQNELIGNIMHELKIIRDFLPDVSLIVKINVLTPIAAMKKVVDAGLIDAIEIPNTLPFGKRPDRVDWCGKFGPESPLKKYGGGGYSGPENLQLALEWIENARSQGVEIPIICGGVSCKRDVDRAKQVGANAIAFARITMSPFHAWKVQGIIQHANQIFG
ncbi:MAG: hypothetical protein OEV93_03195 [Candidatus Moranbacteria bacterium]|nr:hypothetical protein [Candidatus Moranbacteria bacterium]